MLVDDETDFRFSASVALRKAGYDVEEAGNGREAFVKVLEAQGRNNPFSLVVTDVRMPVMSGLELIDEMKRFGIAVPILAVTGFGDEGVRADLGARGCADSLEKPFEPAALVDRVAAIFAKDASKGAGTRVVRLKEGTGDA